VLFFLLLWKTTLEFMLKKNYFHTGKKFRFSMITRIRSQLTYLKNAHFPMCFLFSEIAQDTRKRAYIDLKEYQFINKQYKTEISEIILCKNLKMAYSGFIPPDLAEMATSWANKNLFE
jgi:hypothetical protein